MDFSELLQLTKSLKLKIHHNKPLASVIQIIHHLSNFLLRQHSSQQIIDWDPISLGFLVYIDAVCRL